MRYDEFKELVKDKIKDYLPEEYRDRTVVIKQMEKVNRTLDAMALFKEGEGTQVSPSIYLNPAYQSYLDNGNLFAIIHQLADVFVEAEERGKFLGNEAINSVKRGQSTEKIFFQLINTEMNKEQLMHRPHRDFNDLSVVYKIAVESDETNLASIAINDNIAKEIGLTEEQLFAYASENTKKLFPVEIRDLSNLVTNMLYNDGMPGDEVDLMFSDMKPEEQIYFIGNRIGIHGAASMLYEEELHKLAESVGSDLYILPSSVHEVLAVSVNMGEPEILMKMVEEVNATQVAVEERLSNQVYHYDRNLRTVTLATNNLNKRLDGSIERGELDKSDDGRVAEAPLVYENFKSR